MQQTEKYKLNLIEKDDPFSPDGLNQNTRKVEEALMAHEAAVEEVTDAIAQRVTVLEGHKFAGAAYTGTGGVGRVLELGFQPKAAFIRSPTAGGTSLVALGGYPYGRDAEFVPQGIKILEESLNYSGVYYIFLAFA